MSFLKDIRLLAKDASIYGLSAGVSRMASLFMAPILTRVFVPAEYGIIALIQVAVSFLIIIAGMNVMSGMSFYFYQEDKDEKRKVVLTTGILVSGFIATIVACGMYFFSGQIAELLQLRVEGDIVGYDLAHYIRIASLTMFFSLMLSGAQSIMRLLRQPVVYLKTQIVSLITQIIAVIILVIGFQSGVVGVFWANAISSILACVYGFFIVRKHLSASFSFAALGLMLAYALPQLPGVLVNWGQSQTGRLFINYYESADQLGLYSIGFTIASLLTLCITAFRLAYDPYALSIMKDDGARDVYAKVYKIYILIFGWLLAGIAIFAKPILMILTPVEYHSAYIFVLIIATASFYMGANNILATGIWISKKTSRTSYAQIISFAVLMAFNFVLVPIYGAAGAAYAYLAGSLAQSGAYYLFAQRLWPVAYPYWRGHLIVACIFMICLAHNFVIGSEGLLFSMGVGTITLLVVSIFLLFGGVSSEEKMLLSQLIRTKFRNAV